MLWCCGSNERCRKGWGCDTSPRWFDPQLHADASSIDRQRPSQIMREVWQVWGNRWHDAPSGAGLRVRQLWGEEMNCKPGDLAVIVQSIHGQHGALISVEKDSGRRDNGQHWWLCKALQTIRCSNGKFIHAGDFGYAADANIRPLRDSDGEDEMLRIVGKPQEVNA